MNFKLVVDGDIGVGALVLQLALEHNFPVSGVASPIYEASNSNVDLECGLSRYVEKIKSYPKHKEKVHRLNVENSQATVLIVTKWTSFYSSLFGYTKTLEWRDVPLHSGAPARPCLLLFCDDATQTAEDLASDISMFLRTNWPTSVYICGSADVLRRDKLLAALYAGLKSAESFR
jgi:hypothetical protein